MILTEAASSVGATGRAQWEVSVTSRLDSVGVWKGLKVKSVISAELASTTFQTAGPATVIQQALRPQLASKLSDNFIIIIDIVIDIASLYHCIIVSYPGTGCVSVTVVAPAPVKVRL